MRLLFAVEQAVDSESLGAVHPALVWGREALDLLPQSLNQGHRADLELLGTDAGAGHRSLESVGDPAQ